MRLGHLFTEPESDYFTSGAWGSSSGRRMLVSPQAAHDNFTGVEQISSSAFALGTAWDRFLTGEGTYVVRPSDIDGRTKAGKEWLQAQAPDAQILSSEEGRKMSLMAERMPKSLRTLTDGDYFQMVSRCEMAGFAAQARYDAVSSSAIIDIKTTSSPLEDFARSAYKYGYHFQSGWYRMVWAKASGEKAPPFWFLVTETVSPYRTALFQPDEDFDNHGLDLASKAMMLIGQHTAENDWADTGSMVKTLSLPKWAITNAPQEEDAF